MTSGHGKWRTKNNAAATIRTGPRSRGHASGVEPSTRQRSDEEDVEIAEPQRDRVWSDRPFRSRRTERAHARVRAGGAARTASRHRGGGQTAPHEAPHACPKRRVRVVAARHIEEVLREGGRGGVGCEPGLTDSPYSDASPLATIWSTRRLGKSNRETLGCPAEARPSEPSPRGSNPLPEPLTISRRTRTSHPSLVELAFRMLKMEPCPDTSHLTCGSSSSEPSAHALENASRS